MQVQLTLRRNYGHIISRPTEDFSFHCQYCNKKCSSCNNLRRYEHSHETFEHKCNICHKKFQYPGGLTTHMSIHTRVNLIPCLHCSLKFTTNKVMKNHAKKHNACWIQCDYCSESFDTTWNKEQHEFGSWTWLESPMWEKVPMARKLRTHKRGYSKCQDILQKQKIKNDHLAAKIAEKRGKNK